MLTQFTKMHGLGNDFVVIDGVSQDVRLDPARVRQLADRHFGIGFDQLLLVLPPSDPALDFDYRIFNADGEEVEHCGNGARCFANFVYDKQLTNRNPVRVKTLNRELQLTREDHGMVRVDMGRPEFSPAAIPFSEPEQATTYTREVLIGDHALTVRFTALSMGNPHAVIVVEDLAQTAVTDIGAALGSHPDFPAGVNVGFMQILGPAEISLRVYERGAGETLACGTGACAAVVTGCLLGALGGTVKVNLTGGELAVEWPQGEAPVSMIGPTTTVYDGTIEL